MPSPTTSRIAPARGCSMASPRMCASAPMASITGTDPARRRAWGDRKVYRERLHACANHLNVPTLLVRGGLSDVLSEAGAQSFSNSARTPSMSTWQTPPIWSPVIGMTSSQNQSSHSQESRTGALNAEPARRTWDSADTGEPLCAIWGYGGSMAGPPPWHTASTCSGARSRRVVSTYALS